MAIRDQGGISASDIANAAAAHAVGTLTLDVSADVKQSLLDFLSTANRMVSGSQLGKYFADTETLAKRLGDTVSACGKQFRNLDDSKAKELVNTFNALNSRAGGADISKYFANFTGGFDRVNEAVTRAQGRVGKFIEGFRMEDFNRMFASYDNIVEWTTALGGSKQTVDELIRSLVQLNGADVNSLTARLTTAQQEITRLNNELASAKSGQGFVELQKQIESLTEKLQTAQTEINRVRATAESEFSGFLNGNNINENAWDEATAKPMFQEYFEQIRDGSMTARDAIMRFKEEYGHLLRDRTGSESGLFSSEQVSQFIAKLEEVYIKVEEISNYIRNIGNNAPGLITNAVEKDLQNISKEEQALRHVVDEGGEVGRVGQIVDGVASAVSSGTQKMGEMSEQTVKLVDALTNLGQAGEGSLAAISAIFRNIGTIKDLEVNTDQFKKLKDALEILKDTTGLDKIGLLSNINLQGFSNLKISTTLGHLATYLPPISQNVDVAKLEALSHISLANFNQDNLKVSKASMEHLRDLLAQIQGKPLQTVNNGQTQQLSEEQAMVERLNTTWKTHSDAVAQAIADEQRKSVISTELTAKLQHEKEAMDAVSGSAERGAASGQKYSSVWDKMFLGKFVAEFTKVKAQFDALEDKPAKLAENMRKLESAEKEMHAATNMKDRVDAYERFTTILDVVRTQIGAVNAEARNSNADFKSLLNMVKQAGSAMDGIANSSFTNKLKEMSAKAKGVADESVIRNLKEMRQAYVDMQSAYGTSGPNTEQDYTALINAQIRWKTALNGLNQALTTNRTESAAVNAANREAAQTVKAIADGAAAAEKQVASLNSVFEGLRDKTKFDTSSFDQMRALLDVVNNTSMDTSVRQSALQQLNDLIKQNTDSLHELAAAEKAEADAKKKTDTADRQKAALIKQLNTLLAQCTNAEQRYAIVSKAAFAKENYQGIKDTKTYVQQLLQQLNGTNPKLEEIAVGARNAQTAFSNFNTSLKTSGGLLGNWLTTGMSQLKSRLTYSLGLAAMVYKAVGEIKQMVSTAVELDSAMNTLQIVTRASGGEMEAYAKRVSAAAQETAQSTKDLIDATTVYARLGYSMDESAVLSKYTAMLQGVGDIGATDAQNAMTAIIKSFGKNVGEIEDVMDKLVVVGNNFPISVSQLAEGMNNASSMLAVAGNSFEESIALLTAANTTVQDISKASTALRTIAARIRKMTTEDGEIIEESKYDEMIKALTQHNVSLVDANGEYRKTYDVIKDIAKVWKDLSTMQQAAVSEALAGTRQQNVFSSLVTQFQEAENAIDRMADAGGELQAAYDIRMESIEAHVQRMKAAYDQLSMDFVDSEFAKRAVDLLTNVINLLDLLINKIGVIGTVLGASSLPGIIKLVTSGKLTSAMTQLAGMLGLLKSSSTALTVVGASGATAGVSLAAIGPIVAGVVAVFATLVHVLRQVEKQRRQALSDTYDTSMQHAKEKGEVYDLYLAYLDAKEKQDETEESKKRLKQASEELAVALGYEKDAAEQLNEAFAEMSAEQIKRAASDAKIALDSAQKQLIDAYDNTSSPNGNGQAFVSIFGRGNGIDIMAGDQEERAQSLARVYELMRERQAELADSSQTTTREYINLSDAIKWLKPQVDDLSTATDTLGDMQEHVNDIMRGTTDPAKKLGQALNRLSDNAMQALLSGEYYDEDLEEIRQVMQEYYATPERMQQALKNNKDVILDRVSQPLKNAKEELTRIQKEIADQGIDINKTVFGNIDTNNRQVLEWTEDNLARFKDELASWGEDINSVAGSISTVFGGAANYDGVEIAFSPILQTDQGPVLLSQEAVDDYIWSLVEELNESKEKWSKEDLFELDARGIEKDGRKIQGLIADVGATAEKTSRSMHYLGKDGALSLAERGVQEAQNFLNLFAEEITPKSITSSVEKSIADLSTLRDELKLSIDALTDYKEAMEGGEIDDPIKEAAEIYKGALEDILSGRGGTNRVKNAAELFLGRDTLDAIGWNLEEAGKMLQDHMWKFILDPEGTSDYDYGARVAQYIQANFDKATDGVWMENGKFYYESLDKLAAAFHNSTTAASLFLGALQAHSVNTINSVEENRALIASFRDLESELKSTDDAVRKTVEDMYGNGMDDFQIHDTLDALRSAGVINLDEDELHKIISEVLTHLHEVDNEKVEPEMTLKYDKVTTAVDIVTKMLNDLVSNGGAGWNIDVGVTSSGDISGNTTTQSSGGNQKAKVYTGNVNYPGSAGGKQPGRNGGDTLVNELGPELISDKGRAFIANGGRPGFVRLSDDAIVFTADETKDILRGKRNVNGKALAQGNVSRGNLISRLVRGGVHARSAYVNCWKCGTRNLASRSTCFKCGASLSGQPRYSQQSADVYGQQNAGVNRSGLGSPTAMPYQNMGGSGYDVYGYDSYDYSAYYDYVAQQQQLGEQILAVQRAHDEAMKALRAAQAAHAQAEAEKAAGSKIDSTSKNTTLGKSLAGTGGGNYVGGADYRSYAEPQKVDWVAVRINRLQRAVADLEKVATSGFKMLEDRLTAAKDQIAKVKDQLQVAHSAYARYIQEAESVGLSSDIAQKVKDGTIEISSYDDETRKKIDEYTEW